MRGRASEGRVNGRDVVRDWEVFAKAKAKWARAGREAVRGASRCNKMVIETLAFHDDAINSRPQSNLNYVRGNKPKF